MAYYPFNGNANDESGNANHGTQYGSNKPSLSSDRLNNPNSAYTFSGNGSISIPDRLITTVAYTMSAWFKRTDTNGSKMILYLGAGNPNDILFSSVAEGGGTFYTTGYNRSGWYFSSAPSKDALNKWHHLLFKIDSNANFAFYYDGNIVTNGNRGSAIYTPANPEVRSHIGAYQNVYQSPNLRSSDSFIGGIDDVRIYNRALSDSEVKALYDYESVPTVQTPVFLVQPQSQSVNIGNDATFCVTLKDSGTYNYQWQFNEQNIAGATLNCYRANSVTAAMNGGRYRVIVSNSAGTVISDSATLTVVTPPPPVIATQPIGKTVQEGSNVSFVVVASGQGALVYQWQLNEQNLPGATSATLNLNSVKQNQSGRYRVLVSSPYGVTISDTVILTVNPNPPPAIVTQPIGKTVQEGANVSFNVVATGVGAITYQWQFNEQNLAGATGSTLNLNGVKLNTAGRYRVLVSSQYGVTISDTVTLTVNPNPPPTIVTQPISKTPAEGTQVSLTVTATGFGSLTYQWQINNQNIPGATTSTLVLSAVRPSANGNYRVIVGNPYGTTISTEATVSVVVTDSDSDGLSDYEELLLGTNPNKADSDGDGLSDFAEVKTHGSNPLTTDTDGDGYSDGVEVARDGNPNNRSVTPTGALAVFPAVDVEFYTLNGVKYQLEVSTDMAVWTAQGGVVVGNGGSQNHLVRASKATQFWRLKVVQ